MKKNVEAIDKEEDDQLLPVYEARIIDKLEEKPTQALSYKLGRVMGAIIALTGFLFRLTPAFRSTQRENRWYSIGGMCRGIRKGSGKKKAAPAEAKEAK